MTFTQLSREALEDELRRCNDLLSEDHKRISKLTEQRDRLYHALANIIEQCRVYAMNDEADLPDTTEAVVVLGSVAASEAIR